MKFQKLVKLISEAKGVQPGMRLKGVQEREGPAGFAKQGPMANLNPSVEPIPSDLPKDEGRKAVDTIKLLGKSFQVLNNDEVFKDQMRGIMNGFKKNRKQISAYQESVIKTKPKVIDNLWGQINRLIKIVNDPVKQQDEDEHAKFVAELEKVKARKDEHQKELDDVYSEVDNIVLENEQYNDEYLKQMMTVVHYTAKRLYKQQAQELEKTGEKPQVLQMHELDYSMLEKKVTDDATAQLSLLEMLMDESEDFEKVSDNSNPEDFNPDAAKSPLVIFLNMQAQKYNEAKQRYFEVKRGDNYSVSVEQMYRNLPLFAFTNYFSHVILKSPTIRLTQQQKKRITKMSGDADVMTKLANVKTDAQYENLRPDLVEYLNNLEIPQGLKTSLLSLANGPFVTRKGSANSAVKIRSMLKSHNIEDEEEPVKESFDKIFSKVIARTRYDDDDFKIDTMEVLSNLKKKR